MHDTYDLLVTWSPLKMKVNSMNMPWTLLASIIFSFSAHASTCDTDGTKIVLSCQNKQGPETVRLCLAGQNTITLEVNESALGNFSIEGLELNEDIIISGQDIKLARLTESLKKTKQVKLFVEKNEGSFFAKETTFSQGTMGPTKWSGFDIICK